MPIPVEVDETYVGGKGRALAFPVERVDGRTLQDAIRWRTRNTVGGFFSRLKRGIVGTFHHVSNTDDI